MREGLDCRKRREREGVREGERGREEREGRSRVRVVMADTHTRILLG